MTISTIGYDDCSLTTDVAKIFTIVLTLGGIEKILAIATKVAQGLTRRRAEKKEKKRKEFSCKRTSLSAGRIINNFIAPIIFFVVTILIVIHLPLLAFIPMMIKAKARAINRFGSLIQYHNNLYKVKWMEGKLPSDDNILPSLDNSSMADINTSYQQAVQGMNLIPITRNQIIYAALILMIPFIPLIFTQYSLIELLSKLAQIVTG
jgi:hypothetical protein